MCCTYIISCLRAQEATAWLCECSRDILQYSASDLIRAYTNFYRLVKTNRHIHPVTGKLQGLPSYKSKYQEQSICVQGHNTSVTDSRIRLPLPRALKEQNIHTGILKTRGLRTSKDPLTSLTIRLTKANLYFTTCLFNSQREIRVSGTGSVGLDLMAHKSEVAALYDGSMSSLITDIHPFPKKQVASLEQRIVNTQRKLSKQSKGSNRRKKTKLRLARAHYKLRCLLTNYYHHITTWLVAKYDTICIESLNVRNMVSDAIRPISRLVQNSRFGMIREMLEYKILDSNYGKLVLADPYYPSTQLCSSCGKKPTTKITLNIRSWTCEHCSVKHSRDDNAAINIYNLHQQASEAKLTKCSPYYA